MSGEDETQAFLDIPSGHDDMKTAITTAEEPPSIMRRFALFVDGMARAMILPFGPDLVHRLVYKTSEIEAASWSGVAYYLGWVVSAYIVGRWLGTMLSYKWQISYDRFPKHVARLGGIAMSLHVFTYGAGLGSVKILVFIRFLSAILAGLLCGITNDISLPEDEWSFRHGGKATLEEERMNALSRREGYVDIASGTAKIYLTGFAVSILSGGLLFRQATRDSTFQALTGAYQYSWSPLFLIAVTVSVEIVLRGIFALASNPTVNEDQITAGSRVRGVVRRMVIDASLKSGRDVVYAAESMIHAPRRSSVSSFQPLIEEDYDEEMSQASNPLSIVSERLAYYDADAMTQGERSRRESATSIDDFFDCQSVLSDEEIGFDDPVPPTPHMETTVCSYIGKRCVYSDGSPAFVPPGECVAVIPEHYMKFYNNNETRARKAWEKTQEWRREKNIWRIHDLSNRWFFKIKEAYPHFVHGHTKHGYPVVYEKPGQMRIKEMFREGIGTADMVKHLTFFLEYLSIRLSTSDELLSAIGKTEKPTASTWGMMVVMDLQGLGVSHISGDVLSYLKQASAVNSDHYPMAMKRAFLINSPFWLAGTWSGIKGILPDTVQVDILSANNYRPALLDYIDNDQIPPEYGGTSLYSLGSHPYEIEMRRLVEESMENQDTDVAPKQQQTPTPKLPPKNVAIFDDPSVLKMTSSPIAPKRRRAYSHDRKQTSKSAEFTNTARKSSTCSGCRDVLFLVSSIHFSWSTVQGAIELAIPLWILSPVNMGGLGYTPSRSGVSLFTACLVLLAVLRSRSSRMLSKIPSKSPLRALRIGAGSESALLALLTCVSCFSSPDQRGDSVTAMTCTVILVACMALATMIGRSASKILHRVAAESYVVQQRPAHKMTGNVSQKFLSDCECGRFTASLNLIGEIIGVFLLTPLWTASIVEERQAPFNAVFPLLCCGVVTFILYCATFTLYLNAAGEFAPNPKECCADDSTWRWCLQSMFEAVAVSSSDIASLFEESNWSATPLLGRSRSRTFSEPSAVSYLEMMERGEDPSVGGRKIR